MTIIEQAVRMAETLPILPYEVFGFIHDNIDTLIGDYEECKMCGYNDAVAQKRATIQAIVDFLRGFRLGECLSGYEVVKVDKYYAYLDSIEGELNDIDCK